MVLGMADDRGGITQPGYVHPFDEPLVDLNTGEGFENLGAPGGSGPGGPGIPRAYGRAKNLKQLERQGGKCEYCGITIDTKTSYKPNSMRGDHITPFWLTGRTDPEDLAVSCNACNGSGGKWYKTIGPGPNEWWPPSWGPRPKIRSR